MVERKQLGRGVSFRVRPLILRYARRCHALSYLVRSPRAMTILLGLELDDAKIRNLALDGMSKAQIARELGVSRMTVYRAIDAGGTKGDTKFR